MTQIEPGTGIVVVHRDDAEVNSSSSARTTGLTSDCEQIGQAKTARN
jgi:hypothetical protein